MKVDYAPVVMLNNAWSAPPVIVNVAGLVPTVSASEVVTVITAV